MKKQQKKNIKKRNSSSRDEKCFYCGSENFERIKIGTVSIFRCKNCGEQTD